MNKKCYLKRDFLYEMAKEREIKIELFIREKKKHILNYPKGNLRIIKNKGVNQYYHITKKGDRNGNYIKKKDFNLAKQIAQRDYDEKFIQVAEKQLKAIKLFLGKFPCDQIDSCYNDLKKNRKELIEPNVIPNPIWVKEWKSVEYKGKPFKDDDPELYTSKGNRVRSKSEIIIADTLDRLQIPYRYEYPVKINNYTVYPDFYCLNIINGNEIIWEHFGFMDDSDYVNLMIKKISDYQKEGYYPGKNLIITFENKETPLNTKVVEQIVNMYLCE